MRYWNTAGAFLRPLVVMKAVFLVWLMTFVSANSRRLGRVWRNVSQLIQDNHLLSGEGRCAVFVREFR